MKKDWLALSYIIPFAIGGTLFIPIILIILAHQLSILESLSYNWWLNIAVMLCLVKAPIVNMKWVDWLREAGFLKSLKGGYNDQKKKQTR